MNLPRRSSRRLLRAAGPQESNEKPRGVHVYSLLPVRVVTWVKFLFDATKKPRLEGCSYENRGEKTFRCADCIYRHAEPVHQRAEVLIGLRVSLRAQPERNCVTFGSDQTKPPNIPDGYFIGIYGNVNVEKLLRKKESHDFHYRRLIWTNEAITIIIALGKKSLYFFLVLVIFLSFFLSLKGDAFNYNEQQLGRTRSCSRRNGFSLSRSRLQSLSFRVIIAGNARVLASPVETDTIVHQAAKRAREHAGSTLIEEYAAGYYRACGCWSVFVCFFDAACRAPIVLNASSSIHGPG